MFVSQLERSFEGDSLLHSVGLTRGRDFKEHRCYTVSWTHPVGMINVIGLMWVFFFQNDQTRIEFLFCTKCLSVDVTKILGEISSGTRRAPDVLIMNSTLWDVTRWVDFAQESLLVPFWKHSGETESLTAYLRLLDSIRGLVVCFLCGIFT